MSLFAFTKTVLGSMVSKPATRMYPFEVREAFPGTRGSIAIEIEKCIYCTLCARKCPTSAIVVNKAARSWEIDRLRCISCRACVEACPKDCLSQLTSYSPAVAIKGGKDFFHHPAPKVAAAPGAAPAQG